LSSFFFQAEDGIRDGHVTGVQTCALPISVSSLAPFVASSATGQRGLKDGVEGQPRQTVNIFAARAQGHFPIDDREEWVNHISAKIGRASCRERVSIFVAAV